MMDEEDSQVPIWSYRVNLDKRVRDDHPLRRIRAALDLSFVRKEVAHTYGRRGNKSVPPDVIIRMTLLLFLDDIRSERELMRIIPGRLDCLWFLGYGLDDQISRPQCIEQGAQALGQRSVHILCRFLKEYRLSLPTLQDELHDLEQRLVVDCLVLCSWRLSAYAKTTVTHQKEYA